MSHSEDEEAQLAETSLCRRQVVIAFPYILRLTWTWVFNVNVNIFKNKLLLNAMELQDLFIWHLQA